MRRHWRCTYCPLHSTRLLVKYYVSTKLNHRLSAVAEATANSNDGRFMYAVKEVYERIFLQIAFIEDAPIVELDSFGCLALIFC